MFLIVASNKCCVKIFGCNPGGNANDASVSEAATPRYRTKRQTLQACPASATAHELFRGFSYVGGIALLGIVGLNKRTADVISVRFSNLADRVFTVSMTTLWNIMHQLQT